MAPDTTHRGSSNHPHPIALLSPIAAATTAAASPPRSPLTPGRSRLKSRRRRTGSYWAPVGRCRAERVRRLSAEDHRLHRRICIYLGKDGPPNGA
ncbi:hypothetical protein RHMOL_Rhmol07G0014100 [Rhododendron molle]|uniref:Uncharacterized protein n=1 Tax=Rhododendron molle TaxID=49168 RepID=A0ACC0MWE6_RHOML|nr:hypothetical protein RHMOL_Rhmol07G0014100 [Rhododendron molle]